MNPVHIYIYIYIHIASTNYRHNAPCVSSTGGCVAVPRDSVMDDKLYIPFMNIH